MHRGGRKGSDNRRGLDTGHIHPLGRGQGGRILCQSLRLHPVCDLSQTCASRSSSGACPTSRPCTRRPSSLTGRCRKLSRILEVSGNPIAVLENVEASEDIAVQPNAVWNIPEGARLTCWTFSREAGSNFTSTTSTFFTRRSMICPRRLVPPSAGPRGTCPGWPWRSNCTRFCRRSAQAHHPDSRLPETGPHGPVSPGEVRRFQRGRLFHPDRVGPGPSPGHQPHRSDRAVLVQTGIHSRRARHGRPGDHGPGV